MGLWRQQRFRYAFVTSITTLGLTGCEQSIDDIQDILPPQNDICDFIQSAEDTTEFWLGVNPDHGEDVKIRLPLRYFKGFETAKRHSEKMNGQVSFNIRLDDFAPSDLLTGDETAKQYYSKSAIMTVSGNVKYLSGENNLNQSLKIRLMSPGEYRLRPLMSVNHTNAMPEGYPELELLVFHPEEPTYTDIFANIIDEDVQSYIICSQDYTSTNYKLPNPMCSLFILAEPVRVRMDFARTEVARWKYFENRTKRFVSCVTLIEKN